MGVSVFSVSSIVDGAFGSGELTKAQYEAARSEGDAIVKERCADIGPPKKQ